MGDLPHDTKMEILTRTEDPRALLCACREFGTFAADPTAVHMWAIENERHMFAAKRGLHRAVATLLERGRIDSHDMTEMLIEASANGRPEVVRVLIANGVDVNVRGKERSPLIGACRNGHPEVVRVLMANGADVNESELTTNVDDEGHTPHISKALVLAAEGGHTEVVCLLLDHGANINGWYWECVLTAPCKHGHVEVVRRLLDGGADINAAEGEAYEGAIAHGHCETVELMLERGAGPNHTYNDDGGPCGSPMLCASRHGQLEVVRLLQNRGADVRDFVHGQCALEDASRNGHLGVARQLLDWGVGGVNDAFYAACKGGHLDVVILHLSRGADINYKGGTFNALCAACWKGHTEVVCMLLDHGIDFKDSWPLCIASTEGFVETVHVLLIRGAFTFNQKASDGFQRACENGHAEVVSLLIRWGLDLYDRPRGLPILYKTCENGHAEVVRILVMTRMPGVDWPHLLRLACTHGRLDMVRLLLDLIPSLTHIWSGLLLACEQGHVEVVRLLLGRDPAICLRGARDLLVDCASQRILGIAPGCERMRRQVEVVRLLEDWYADVDTSA